MGSRSPRLILANTLNSLTMGDRQIVDPAAIDLAAFQELWLIEPGDIFVTSRPMPSAFVESVCERVGVEVGSFDIVNAGSAAGETIVEGLRRSRCLNTLRRLICDRPGIQLRGCSLDREVIEFAADLDMQIEGYTASPSESLIELIFDMNTKAGFRNVAQRLSLPIASGRFSADAAAATDATHAVLRDHGGVLIKCNRGAGGSGQFIVEDAAALTIEFQEFLQEKSAMGHTFVVEALVRVNAEPTIDVEIREDRVRHLYVGTMQVAQGSFQGMSVPPEGLSATTDRQLRGAADRLASFLAQQGYRGFFDIDGGQLENGELVLFEFNIRRTSTSLWADVLDRMGLGHAHWRLRTIRTDMRDERKIPRTAASLSAPRGQLVIPTWSASKGPASLRYLAAAKDEAHLNEVEERFLQAVIS